MAVYINAYCAISFSQLDDKIKQELLESEAELYTLEEDGTLSQVVVHPEELLNENAAEFDDNIEILYLDTDENCLTTVDGKDIVVEERDGQMVLVEEGKVDQCLNEVVLQPIGTEDNS